MKEPVKDIEEIKKDKERLIRYWKDNNIISDEKVIDAFIKIPREEFMDYNFIREAYADYPSPIGYGQTISQPTTIAIMTQALELDKGMKVLEIGTGSGYQAALIAHIIKSGKVITTEIVPGLVKKARNNLFKAGIINVEVVPTDGSLGWPKEKPYDRIIVTAACPRIADTWVDQLKVDGILVAPVGSLYEQEMIKLVKKKNKIETKSLGRFMFVPLKGMYGFSV